MAAPTITVTTTETTVNIDVNLGVTALAVLAALGIPSYANLAAANAALGIGKTYFDTELATLNITTA